MPRNGSGVYSAPPGTTAAALAVIESAKYNSFVADIVADANAARPVTAGGTGATSAAGARTNLGVPATVATTTDNALVRFDGVTGAQQNSTATVSDTGSLTLPDNASVTIGVAPNQATMTHVKIPGETQFYSPNLFKFINGAATALSIVGTGELRPGVADGGSLGASSVPFSDLFLASGGVLNWNAGDVTVTHSSNALAFAGAASGYTFDAAVSMPDISVSGLITSTRSAISANGPTLAMGKSGVTLGAKAGQIVSAAYATANKDWTVLGTFDDNASRTVYIGGGSFGRPDATQLNFYSAAAYNQTDNAGVLRMQIGTDGHVKPGANDGGALGVSGTAWADLFLASGGVINFSAGDVTVTHSADALAFAGAASGYSFDAIVKPSANDSAALGSAAVSWADLFLASGGVVNFNNGDVLITHSANLLAFTGASSGYTFDAATTPATNDGAALGSSTVRWSDLYLADGGIIRWAAGSAIIFQSGSTLNFSSATNYAFDADVTSQGAVTAVNSFKIGGTTVVDANAHHQLRSYTVAGLPSASVAAQMIYVSNGTANKRLAVSDGTNWRWPDGAIVS